MKILMLNFMFACSLVGLLTGCKSVLGPAKPPTADYNKILKFDYTNAANSNYFRTAYREALNLTSSDLTDKSTFVYQNYGYQTNQSIRAILVRNDIVLELRSLINQNYADYRVALRDDRNVKDLGLNLAAMGLTAAATVAGGATTKTILSAIATGVLGANAEVDRQLFKSLTTEAMANQMDNLRAKQDIIILGRFTNNVSSYPLDMALDDVNKLYQAGFITSALQSLVVDAGQAAKTNQATVETIKSAILIK